MSLHCKYGREQVIGQRDSNAMQKMLDMVISMQLRQCVKRQLVRFISNAMQKMCEKVVSKVDFYAMQKMSFHCEKEKGFESSPQTIYLQPNDVNL